MNLFSWVRVDDALLLQLRKHIESTGDIATYARDPKEKHVKPLDESFASVAVDHSMAIIAWADGRCGYAGSCMASAKVEKTIRLILRDSSKPASLFGEADLEWGSRIEAQRVTAQFRVPIVPKVPQNAIEDLPLFGGERQGDLFS